MLKVEAWGLNPNVTYEIRGNYLEGTATAREPFAYVKPDATGYLHVNLRGISPAFMGYDDYEMEARILVVRPNGWRVLTTAEIGGGTLEGAGSNRGE